RIDAILTFLKSIAFTVPSLRAATLGDTTEAAVAPGRATVAALIIGTSSGGGRPAASVAAGQAPDTCTTAGPSTLRQTSSIIGPCLTSSASNAAPSSRAEEPPKQLLVSGVLPLRVPMDPADELQNRAERSLGHPGTPSRTHECLSSSSTGRAASLTFS